MGDPSRYIGPYVKVETTWEDEVNLYKINKEFKTGLRCFGYCADPVFVSDIGKEVERSDDFIEMEGTTSILDMKDRYPEAEIAQFEDKHADDLKTIKNKYKNRKIVTSWGYIEQLG